MISYARALAIILFALTSAPASADMNRSFPTVSLKTNASVPGTAFACGGRPFCKAVGIPSCSVCCLPGHKAFCRTDRVTMLASCGCE
jgi:hypothetical protein